MSPPVLHYFSGRGKAETIRLMLAAAGVQYVEAPYITQPEDVEKKRQSGSLLFQQVPLLEIDGKNLVQSSAIVRYLAHKYGLFGKNEDERVQIDILAEGAKDFLAYFMTFSFFDDAKLLDAIYKKALPRYMPIFEKLISESKSGYLVGDSLSMADVCLLEVLLQLPERAPDAFNGYPKLKGYLDRISSLPKIAAYLKGPQRAGPNTPEYAKVVRHALQWFD
jgi:glutathione S-transferase